MMMLCKKIAFALVFVSLLTLVGCAEMGASFKVGYDTGSKASDTPSTKEQPTPTTTTLESTPTPSPKPSVVATPSDSIKAEDKIEITSDIDETLSNAIVFFDNNSNQSFTGDVFIYFYNASNEKVGFDMAIIEKLGPGQRTYVKISLFETQDVRMEYNFAMGYIFEDVIVDTSSKSIYQPWTDALSTDFESSFGDVSWYKSIDELEVYKISEPRDAKVIVMLNSDNQEHAKSIGNCIYANYGIARANTGDGDFEVSSVIVLSSSGNELFVRAK